MLFANRSRPSIAMLSIIAGSLWLAACSEGADEVVFDTALGPRTQTQAKQLPNDLRGPENTNYRAAQKSPDLEGAKPRPLVEDSNSTDGSNEEDGDDGRF